MEPDSSAKSRLTLAVVMIGLGLLAVWAGARDILRHWSYLVFGARVCDLLVMASGVLLLFAGLWICLTRGAQSAAVAVGSLAAGLFAVTVFTGVLTGAIPCSGPG